MKILGLGGVITIFGDWQVARNIERDFVPEQKHPLPERQHTSQQSKLFNEGKKTTKPDPKQQRARKLPFNIALLEYVVLVSKGFICEHALFKHSGLRTPM
jgi:hypothetical protein